MQAIAVPARIDMDNAAVVLAELSRALRDAAAGAGQAETVLDLSGLGRFDSSALSVLLQLAREGAQRNGGAAAGTPGAGSAPRVPLLLLGPPAKLRELAALYGVDELLFGGPAEP